MLDWTKPYSKGTHYYFDFSKKHKTNIDPIDAAKLTIDYITSKYPPPYTLYLSGGSDSLALLYAWHKHNVPYKTFSAVYNDGLNDHDLIGLRAFSKIHNIDVTYHDFDLINFLETEHDYYADHFSTGSPQITTFMKLADLTTSGTVIMSGNFIMSNRMGIPDKNNWGLYHYGVRSNKSIVPWFFLETSELAHSFIPNEYSEQFKTNNPGGYLTKIALYQSYGFPVLAQSEKQNGFEKIKELYDTNPPRIIESNERINRIKDQISNRNFDILYRNKYESKIKDYKYYITTGSAL